MSEQALRFSATVAQVKTMADGGIRVAIDLPETAAAMMQAKQAGAILECAVMAVVKQPSAEKEIRNDRPKAKHFTPYAKQTKTEA